MHAHTHTRPYAIAHPDDTQLVSSTLRAVQLVIAAMKKLSTPELEDLVPLLCGYMVHGLPAASADLPLYTTVRYKVFLA